jgi:histidine decarboxylase
LLQKYGVNGLRKRAQDALDVASYAQRRLNDIGVDAWRNPNALTVVFPKPPESIRTKWQLATQGDISHLIAVPGVTKAQIDDFVADLAAVHQPQ